MPARPIPTVSPRPLRRLGLLLPLATLAVAVASAVFTTPSQAAGYTFSQGGFEGGGQITGSFAGDDLDGDGWLFGFEITAFSLNFSGNALVPAFTHGQAQLGGIGYRIGETVIGGHDNSHLFSSSDFGDRFVQVDAFGWPEFTIPGRISDDPAGTVLTTSQWIQVAAVPEPAGWALWAGGLGALLRVARRRTRR